MTSHHKKVITKADVVKKYSPVALVTEHGDSWLTYNKCNLNAVTNIALRSTTHDRYDALLMDLMEKGVIGRINEF